MKLILRLVVQLGFIFSSCESNDPSVELLPPTNLIVDVKVSEEGAGLVEVNASATDAAYFEFEFGEDSGDPPIRDADGFIEYTYAQSGSYTVIIRAHTTPDIFLETSESILVEIGASGTIPESGYLTPQSYNGYNLVWQDEFNGSSLDTDIWRFEEGTGDNGWGNNELQYYRKANTIVKDGYLIIEAKKEIFGGKSYTSSRIITQGNESFKYGRIDIRAALPKGQGIWPALWMLGANFGTVGWPGCGEIDIMEMVGGTDGDNTVHGTVHWDNAGSYASYGNSYTLPSGIFADEFHVFSIIWNESTIEWYMDDVRYHIIDITPSGLSEFQNEFFFIFNVAVGGNWPGNPNASTTFPQRMIVDYVRVFQ